MTDTSLLERVIGRVRREARWRHAEGGAWRGLFWGAAGGALVLAAKGALGPGALPFALAAALGGLLGGALVAALRAPTRLEAARLADRALGLDDRVATSVEYAAARAQRAPLVEALLADTARRLSGIEPRSLLKRVMPREVRYLPLPLLAVLILILAPAFTGPAAWIPEWLGAQSRERSAQQPALAALEQRGASVQEFLRRKPLAAQEANPSAQKRNAPTATEAQAQFRDKALTASKVDFSSFLKKGDERLRLLENAEKLPDLQSDFASSKYKSMLRKSQELSAGNRPRNISARKLAELLREMERLGRKDPNLANEVAEAMEALEQGQTGNALEAMQNALEKLRELEDQQRGSRNLRGGRDTDQDARAPTYRSADQEMLEQNPERQGVGAGSGKGPDGKGKPSPRLRSTPYTSGVQGDRRNRLPNYETQMQGNSGSSAAQAQYPGVIGQYRRMMEDAMTREQVPRDYHEQIRDYFKSLNER